LVTATLTVWPIHHLCIAHICKWKLIWRVCEDHSCTHLWWIFWPENFCCQVRSV